MYLLFDTLLQGLGIGTRLSDAVAHLHYLEGYEYVQKQHWSTKTIQFTLFSAQVLLQDGSSAVRLGYFRLKILDEKRAALFGGSKGRDLYVKIVFASPFSNRALWSIQLFVN